MNINIRFFSVISFFLFLFSCAEIKLIQDYDAVSNNKINLLHDKTTKFFVKIQRTVGLPENKYEKHIDFYDDVKSDVHVLQTRTKAIDKSNITHKQLTSLLTQINTLEKLHQLGFKSNKEIIIIQSAIDESFTAILKLQIALKNKSN
ncbi:MAG: hypothetical protein ACO3AW_02560 [Chitinophagaceae bacterium]